VKNYDEEGTTGVDAPVYLVVINERTKPAYLNPTTKMASWLCYDLKK